MLIKFLQIKTKIFWIITQTSYDLTINKHEIYFSLKTLINHFFWKHLNQYLFIEMKSVHEHQWLFIFLIKLLKIKVC